MNIEGANLSMLSGSNSAGPGAGSSLAKTGIDNDFADTFKDQIELSKTANNQTEISPRDAAELQKKQPQNDANPLQANNYDDEELAAILGNDSPLSDKTDVNADLESALAALTDALSPAKSKPDEDTADETNQQNIGDVMALSGLSFAKPPTEEANPDHTDAGISVDNLAQNKPVFTEPAQDIQETGLQSLDSTDSTEKTAPVDPSSVPEQKDALPGMHSLQRPVDNKTEYTAIAKPLNHPGWSKDLGEHIVWLYNKTIPSAEITLNPEHLGPISVRIDVNQDQTSILFTTQHAATKEALEASIPKLREMLSNQQLNLTDINVSQQSTSNQQHSSSHQDFADARGQWEQKTGDNTAADVIEQPENGQAGAVKGLLSLYA